MTYEAAYEAIKLELQLPQLDYNSAKAHSRNLDNLLGYDCIEIEDALYEENQAARDLRRQYWFGLDIQSLQTPYSEIVEMINELNPQSGDVWMDLGAAYGRVGVTLGFLRPEVQFVGYELVQARVSEGRRVFDRWKLSSAKIKKADLASQDFEVLPADIYFLYDFGTKKDVYDVLEKLRVIAQSRSIQVIARGRGIRNWIPMDFPWLAQMNPPKVFGNWTLFKS